MLWCVSLNYVFVNVVWYFLGLVKKCFVILWYLGLYLSVRLVVVIIGGFFLFFMCVFGIDVCSDLLVGIYWIVLVGLWVCFYLKFNKFWRYKFVYLVGSCVYVFLRLLVMVFLVLFLL